MAIEVADAPTIARLVAEGMAQQPYQGRSNQAFLCQRLAVVLEHEHAERMRLQGELEQQAPHGEA